MDVHIVEGLGVKVDGYDVTFRPVSQEAALQDMKAAVLGWPQYAKSCVSRKIAPCDVQTFLYLLCEVTVAANISKLSAQQWIKAFIDYVGVDEFTKIIKDNRVENL